jgi:hypothetical protein
MVINIPIQQGLENPESDAYQKVDFGLVETCDHLPQFTMKFETDPGSNDFVDFGQLIWG